MQTVKSLSCSINSVEESYDSLQITVLEMEEIVFFHGGSWVLFFSLYWEALGIVWSATYFTIWGMRGGKKARLLPLVCLL